MKSLMKHAALATAFGIAIAPCAVLTAQAGAGDYEFQLVTKELKSGPSAEIAVRLVHKPDDRPVPELSFSLPGSTWVLMGWKR